ncbi:Deaminated glutathione amidase [Methylobacterium crusticola]|uniref:Deaminated glutathione amidase n=1 Tax=Methylobacterium crusticola TaxID=1697972 RepID=A0ABQ4R3L0_9HYPH|nr:carbon-nitrogen hydrolase family protein [Methylobacterium crusticola]GJD51744.1 Deaminated glutathione amidase [Methylobacterium crusticola]
MKVSLIQMNSQNDKAANLRTAREMIEKVVTEDRADLIVLPEYFAFLDASPEAMRASAENFPNGESYRLISGLAEGHKVTIHAGSVVEQDGNDFYNATLVFGPDGRQLAHYRKMHLFDVDAPGGASYRESNMVSRGERIVTYEASGGVKVGCAICYDIRFPELFRKLRDAGAAVIVLPAAFTLMTGKDHWELLARARACETQTWFLATGQTGTHAGGRNACFGHSMIVNPWGHVTAQASDGVGTVSGRLDFAYTDKVRAAVPVAQHHVIG